MTHHRLVPTTLLLLGLGSCSTEAFQTRISKPLHHQNNLKYVDPSFEENLLSRDDVASPLLRSENSRFAARPKSSYETCSQFGSNRHSSKDWLHNFRTIRNSTVLREIRNPVISSSVWAAAVAVVHKLLPTAAASKMCIPIFGHSLVVSMLGLLLVFRTNSAYQRFLEGRKIWEQILTNSRNLSRMLTLYQNELGTQRVKILKDYMAAFPYLLRHHIQTGCLCKKDVSLVPEHHQMELFEYPLNHALDSRYTEGDHLMLEQDAATSSQCIVDRRELPWSLFQANTDKKMSSFFLSKLARSSNRPLMVCDAMSSILMGAKFSENYTSRERLSLLSQIDKLSQTIGQCERIHQTAVPLNYARHALRSLSFWILTLPFALVKDLGMLTPITTMLMSWLLFGVYQIGYSIEDPFQKSLRLSRLCDAIRRDILNAERFDHHLQEQEQGRQHNSMLLSDDELLDLPPILPSPQAQEAQELAFATSAATVA